MLAFCLLSVLVSRSFYSCVACFCCVQFTVKPFMLACSLFREFRELNKTAKLKGVNIDTAPALIGITHVLESCGLNSPK